VGFDWNLVVQSLPAITRGAWMTLILTVISISLGLVLGTILGLMRLARFRLVSAFASAYVWFFRGTPLLIQLFLIYYAMPPLLGITLDRWQAGITALSLNSAAYIAEIVRAGIQSIDVGQTEAAYALGLTKFQTARFIVLPQAFRRIIPPLGNEFILLLKDSSLVSVIALEELLRAGQLIVTRTFKPVEILCAHRHHLLDHDVGHLRPGHVHRAVAAGGNPGRPAADPGGARRCPRRRALI